MDWQKSLVLSKKPYSKGAFLLLVFLGALAAFFLTTERRETAVAPSPQATPSTRFAEKADLIRVSFPTINAGVSSPLIVTGEARGYWFFEASFPVELLDANGEELSSGVAQAQQEWMTEDFVPFRAELEFPAATTDRGTLVLRKDNPSGEPQFDDELRVPVRFAR